MRAEPRREIENVLDQAKDEDADDGSPDSPIAPRQNRSTDDDGCNRFEFPKDTGGWRRRAKTWHVEMSRDAHAQPLENIGCNPDAAYIDGRIPGDRGIGTDGGAMAAEAGAPENELTNDGEDGKGNDRISDPEQGSVVDRSRRRTKTRFQRDRAAI